MTGYDSEVGGLFGLVYAFRKTSAEYFAVSNQPEETPEVRRNRVIGDAIGLTLREVARYVTCIQRKGDSNEYIVYFGLETPAPVLSRVIGLQAGLFTHTRPIDFDGLQISSI